MKMKDEMKKDAKTVPFDNEMIVFEGCEQDDKIVLGGKMPFLSHFCTFFKFNICEGRREIGFLKNQHSRFNDPAKVDEALEDLIKSMD